MYDHMTTTNPIECKNSVLKGTCFLLISAFVKTTFKRLKSWFVEWGFKTNCMIRVDHQYPKDITTLLRKNEQQSTMCHAQKYNHKNSDFYVKEIFTPQLSRLYN